MNAETPNGQWPIGRRGLLRGAAALALGPSAGWAATPAKPAWPGPARIAERLLPLLIKPGAPSRALSPVSLASALQLLAVGARGGSETALNDALGGEGDADQRAAAAGAALASLSAARSDGVTFRHALAGWARDGEFTPKFAATARERLGATLGRLPPGGAEAAALVNKWVDDATAGEIKELVQTLDPSVAFVLTSALSFRAPWTQPFDPESTVLKPFHSASGSVAPTPMMISEGMLVGYATFGGCHAVQMRYGAGQFRATFITSTAVDQPDNLIRFLDRPNSFASIAGLSFDDNVLQVAVPRFNIESEVDFAQNLPDLGLASALSDTADYRDLLSPPVAPSAFLHRVKLYLNEAGTTAVAATALIASRSLAPPPNAAFILDRPFSFVINDTSTSTPIILSYIKEIQA